MEVNLFKFWLIFRSHFVNEEVISVKARKHQTFDKENVAQTRLLPHILRNKDREHINRVFGEKEKQISQEYWNVSELSLER